MRCERAVEDGDYGGGESGWLSAADNERRRDDSEDGVCEEVEFDRGKDGVEGCDLEEEGQQCLSSDL